jgi:hypothetical protein
MAGDDQMINGHKRYLFEVEAKFGDENRGLYVYGDID